MAKSRAPLEVLVIGSHPSAYLCALLLHNAEIRVQLAAPAPSAPDRLVHLNPAFFALDEITRSLRDDLEITEYRGLVFLGDKPGSKGIYDQPSPVVGVTRYSSVERALRRLVDRAKIPVSMPKEIDVGTIHEKGVEVTLDAKTLHPRLILASDPLPEAIRRSLGVPLAWDADTLQTYAFVQTTAAHLNDNERRFFMTLELDDAEHWGWAYQHDDVLQIAVTASPMSNDAQLKKSLQRWIDVLRLHHAITSDAIDIAAARHMRLPLGGALTQEDVGNRTLLFGPAGGFYSASGEDIYPNCWSGIFAADLAKKCLKEDHLQDGLQAYRHKWGATLGDYLRGPQQNLKFLLPLVYRNPVMCARLAESVLTGTSVVR